VKLRLLAVGLLLSALVAWIAPARADGHAVGIQGSAYKTGNCPSPGGSNSIVVDPGDTITWTNCDATSHTVTFDDGTFTRTLGPTGTPTDSTGSVAITHAVTYHCEIHSFMHGSVSFPAQATTTTKAPTTTAKPTTTTAKPTTTAPSTTTSTPPTTLDINGLFDEESTTTSSSSSTTSTTAPEGKAEDGSNALVVGVLLLAIAGAGVGVYYAVQRMRQAD
jgi:plastocyanin